MTGFSYDLGDTNRKGYTEKAKIKSSSRDGLQVFQFEGSNPRSVFHFLSPCRISLGHMFIFMLEV